MPTISYTTAQAGAQISRGDASWGTVGSGYTVSYGFRQSAPGYTSATRDIQGTFAQFSAAEIAATEMALQAWADVANISFSRVAPGAYTNSATMLFANYSSSTDKAAGFAYRPSTDNTSAASPEGDVWYDAYDGSTTSLPIGDYDFYTILHEIGHAIGLLHPGDYNAGSGQTITYQAHALYIEDTRQYSAMSYFDASLTGASHYGSSAATPLLHDIAAVQRLYGANMTTRTGDTTYGFNSNAGRAAFDFNINTAPVIAIWDAGGIDTLDASGYYSSQFIDLRSGLFSNIGGLIKNVAIAEGATVENAKGGFGNDTLAGNGVGNVLHGNSGYDTLLGGAGVDVLYGGADNDTLDGGTEVDTLYGEGGDDTYKIYDGDVVYEVAGEGKDTITTETRNISLLDYLYGRDFSYIEAIILGGGLALSATGDNGANSFTGNSAANQFTGLGGDDTYLIGLNDTIIEDAGTAGGIDTVEAVNRGIDLLNFANVENLTLFGNLGYGGSGTNEANVLRADGNTAANLLAGRGGNDLYYVGAGDTIFELAGAIGGTDTVCGVNRGINLAHFANVENIVLFGSLGYGASGNAGVNIIRGDTNSGANKLVGAGGNDLFYVGAGDTIFEVAGAAGGNDTVAATNRGINLVSYANVENLTLYGTLGYGGAGTTGANVINGETNTGANLLVGLAGNDTYIVGTGDRVTEKLNAGTDVVKSSTIGLNLAAFVNVENLTLLGTANLFGIGSAGTNSILGNNGMNSLNAGAGNDLVYGMLGNDTLYGGVGLDSFFFNTALSAATNVDRIMDFRAIDDTIRLENAIFTNFGTATGTVNAAFFRVGAAALDANDYFIYNPATGALIYDTNGNGAGGDVQFATLVNLPVGITAADFVLI